MGIDVAKNHQVIVFVEKNGIRSTVGNFTEKAVFFHGRGLLLSLPPHKRLF
jgi:hypothetical protein